MYKKKSLDETKFVLKQKEIEPAPTPEPEQSPEPEVGANEFQGEPETQSFDSEDKDDKPFDDEPFDAGVEADEETEPKKYIQQLSGKLGQSLRQLTDDQGAPDLELEKFAINSVLSATHTSQMDAEDQNDIIKQVKKAGQGDEKADDDIDIDSSDDNQMDIDVTNQDEEGFEDEEFKEEAVTVESKKYSDVIKEALSTMEPTEDIVDATKQIPILGSRNGSKPKVLDYATSREEANEKAHKWQMKLGSSWKVRFPKSTPDVETETEFPVPQQIDEPENTSRGRRSKPWKVFNK